MNLLNVGMNLQRNVSHFLFLQLVCEREEQDLTTKLKAFRVRNINRIIIVHININLIRNKIDLLAEEIRGNIDMVSETKIDDTFPTSQFIVSGFDAPFRFEQKYKGVLNASPH